MKKKNTQSSQPNTEILPLAKNRTWIELIDAASYNMFPEKDDWRRRLMYTLFLWAEEEESLQLQDFCTQYKIPRSTLYEWRDKYNDLGEVVNQVKLILGARRLKGALKKDFDKEVVFKDIHKLDPEYLDINKYHAELKKNEGPAEIKQIVEYREITSNLKAREVGVKDDKLSEEESAKSQDTV